MANSSGMSPRTYSLRNFTQQQNIQPLCQIATPVGMLGYGFDEVEFDQALEKLTLNSVPTAIILDSGSTDSGPSKLATGKSTCPKSSYTRDLKKLVDAVLKYRVPLLFSSAGGDGSDAHVDEMVEIVQEIMENSTKKLNILAVYSQIPKPTILSRLQAGHIHPCGPVPPPLTAEAITTSPTIVAQMGPEPLLSAMLSNPTYDILITGRAYDPAPYIAYCAFQHHLLSTTPTPFTSLPSTLLGGFTHMGKILECGGLCATPKSRGALATIYTDGTFDISPTSPSATCTTLSVAAHTLYEKSRPDLLYGPGGVLDLTTTRYDELQDGISVRVRGARFRFTRETGEPYTVKLEAARNVGFRTLFIGSFCDPILISQLLEYLETGRGYVAKQHTGVEYKLDFHLTGLEDPSVVPKKVFIVGEILAETQELANDIAQSARVYCVHGAYPDQKCTSGNFAFGIGGALDLPIGECAEFSIYHLMDLLPGEENAVEKDAPHDVMEFETAEPLFRWKKFFDSKAMDNYTRRKSAIHATPLLEVQAEKLPRFDVKISHISSPRTMRDIATVIRSKNAGPFEVTFDVMFEDIWIYQAVKKSGLLTSETIAELYKLGSVKEIIWCGFFDQAMAFKATLPRTRKGQVVCSGGFMEDDVHGSQQYMPLMELPLNKSLIQELGGLL